MTAPFQPSSVYVLPQSPASTSSNPLVAPLWGRFCRDVFRHPWFLFECLKFPTREESLFSASFCRRFIPRPDIPAVVISTKMLFYLDVNDSIRELDPPSTGFVHLNHLVCDLLDTYWTDRWIQVARSSNARILDVRVWRRECFSHLSDWNGSSLILRSTGDRNPPDPPVDFEEASLKQVFDGERDWSDLIHLELHASQGDQIRTVLDRVRNLQVLVIRSASLWPINEALWTSHLKVLELLFVEFSWKNVVRSLDNLESLTLAICATHDDIFQMQKLPKLKALKLCTLSFDGHDLYFCQTPSEEWSFQPSGLLHLSLMNVPSRVLDHLLRNGTNLQRLALSLCRSDYGQWNLPCLSSLCIGQNCDFPSPLFQNLPVSLERLISPTPSSIVTELLCGEVSMIKELAVSVFDFPVTVSGLAVDRDFHSLRRVDLFGVTLDGSRFQGISRDMASLVSPLKLRLHCQIIKQIRTILPLLLKEEVRLRLSWKGDATEIVDSRIGFALVGYDGRIIFGVDAGAEDFSLTEEPPDLLPVRKFKKLTDLLESTDNCEELSSVVPLAQRLDVLQKMRQLF